MITFKQFLHEIDHDDTVYNKEASAHVASRAALDDSWKPLPMKLAFEIKNYECLWKPDGAEKHKLMLLDVTKKQPAIMLELTNKTVKVPGGTLHGIITTLVSSRAEYRGKGLPLKVYESLVKNGQILFSSTSQTSGSRKIWEALVQGGTGVPFVLATDAAARWYIRRAPEYEHPHAPNVLLTGPFENMDDEAYASEETRWAIIPHDTVTTAISTNTISLPQ